MFIYINSMIALFILSRFSFWLHFWLHETCVQFIFESFLDSYQDAALAWAALDLDTHNSDL